MVNIKTEFPRGISDQVISFESGTPPNERAAWSGPQATSCKRLTGGEPGKAVITVASCKRQASSTKRQAFEPTCSSIKRQASSPRQQASSVKPQAASSLILEPWYMDIGEVLGGKGPRAFTMINVFLG